MVLRVRWLIAAAVVLLAGAVLALLPVRGTFDSESFHCGTAFHYDNSEGYAGSSEFAACNSHREARKAPASGLILIGLGIGAFASVSGKKRADARTAVNSSLVP